MAPLVTSQPPWQNYEELREKYNSRFIKREAQEAYCREHNLPYFVLSPCPMCKAHVFDHVSEELAGTQLITGCPVCNFSFCE